MAPLQTTIWRGMRLATPADWELALVSAPGQDARCVFMDRRDTRLDLRWRVVEAAPNLDLMLDKHLQGHTKANAARRVPMRDDAWRAVERVADQGVVVHAGKYFPDTQWLAEVILAWPDGRDQAREADILAAIGPDPAVGDTLRWEAMGLAVRVPRDLAWPDCVATVGRVCWNFVRGEDTAAEQLSVERLAMPGYWLTGDIAEWLVHELPRDSVELSRERTRINGHEACMVISRHTVRRRPSLPAARRRLRADVAWQCPAENRIYRLSYTVPARNRGQRIAVPEGTTVTCCKAPPSVVAPSRSQPGGHRRPPPPSPRGGPESVDDLLAGVPLINQAAAIARNDDGTAVVRVPIRRPRYLVPPLSWILPFSSHRNVRLDKLGARVLELCAQHRSLESLITQFAVDHKLSYREAQLSMTPFLRSLTERGVLVVTGPRSVTLSKAQRQGSADRGAAAPGLVVQKQVRLSFSRCLELVLSGLRFRLFRASITVGIIALAVAFLMAMLAEALVGRRVRHSLDERTAPRRAYLFWISHLTVPLSESRLTLEAAAVEPGNSRWRELAAWCGLNEAGMRDVSARLRQAATYRAFFEALPEGRRRPLLGNARGLEVFDALRPAASFERFRANIATLGLRFPTSLEEFEEFLSGWEETADARRRMCRGHQQAVGRAAALLAQGTATHLLADLDEPTHRTLLSFGFAMTPDESAVVRVQAGLERDAERIREKLTIPLVRQRLASRLDIGDVATVMPPDLYRAVASPDGARWFTQLLAAEGQAFPLTAPRVREVAQSRLQHYRLQEVEAAVRPMATAGGLLGFSPRVLCLVAVSLLVCMVGIANAMLMSVMERFREIATMKCLGATDRFLMTNFILESCCQGLAGGVVGAVLGLILGTVKAAALYGGIAFASVPVAGLLAGGAAAIALGMILSSLAAVYPSTVAARLAPMEAMRVE